MQPRVEFNSSKATADALQCVVNFLGILVACSGWLAVLIAPKVGAILLVLGMFMACRPGHFVSLCAAAVNLARRGVHGFIRPLRRISFALVNRAKAIAGEAPAVCISGGLAIALFLYTTQRDFRNAVSESLSPSGVLVMVMSGFVAACLALMILVTSCGADPAFTKLHHTEDRGISAGSSREAKEKCPAVAPVTPPIDFRLPVDVIPTEDPKPR